MVMILHKYDLKNGEYKGTQEAQKRPNGQDIIDVIGATTQAPPVVGEKQAACWTGTAWEVVDDHRQKRDKGGVIIDTTGTPYWLPGDTHATPARYLTELGPLPKNALLKRPEKTQKDIEAEESSAAQMQANSILNARMRTATLQTAAFSVSEFAIMAKAHVFESWQAGQTYEAGYRLVHEGIVYEVVQQVTARSHQPPNAEGMLAIYRPLSVDAETGEQPDGTKAYPYVYIHGMDVKDGSYYTFAGKLWLAKSDMVPCVWDPGTPGLWQWEEVAA